MKIGKLDLEMGPGNGNEMKMQRQHQQERRFIVPIVASISCGKQLQLKVFNYATIDGDSEQRS